MLPVFAPDSRTYSRIRELSDQLIRDQEGSRAESLRETLSRIPELLIREGLAADITTDGTENLEDYRALHSSPDSYESLTRLSNSVGYLRSLGSTLLRAQFFLFLDSTCSISKRLATKLERNADVNMEIMLGTLTEALRREDRHPLRFLSVHKDIQTIPPRDVNFRRDFGNVPEIAMETEWASYFCYVDLEDSPVLRRYLRLMNWYLRDTPLRVIFVPGKLKPDGKPMDQNFGLDGGSFDPNRRWTTGIDSLRVRLGFIGGREQLANLMQDTFQGVSVSTNSNFLPYFLDNVGHIAKALITLSVFNSTHIFYNQFLREGGMAIRPLERS